MFKVENLHMSYGQDEILKGISLDVTHGESLAIIGESGAGKTTFGLSIMRLVEGNVSGKIILDDLDLLSLPEDSMRKLRWNKVSMVFQNSNNVLNPVHKIIDQVIEPMTEHRLKNKLDARESASALLISTGFPKHRFNAYPHQLSGGEQQRVLIAMALANDPELIIMDEPLSSLDATSTAEIIDMLRSLQQNHIFIITTHDISTAARLADKVATMYAGRIMEFGPSAEVLSDPRHPYTRALLRSYPNMTTGKDLQGVKGQMDRSVSGCTFHPRCTQAIEICTTEAPSLVVHKGKHLACHRGGIITMLATKNMSKSYGNLKVVDSVSLNIKAGETLALVGQSGSGKTTLVRMITGLVKQDNGEVYLEGTRICKIDKDFCRKVQMIFQNPGEALSHRLDVLELVREPLDIQGIGSKEEREGKVIQVLREVELPTNEHFLETYPHHLSGGEMQRVCIARALVMNPEVLIADEPTSFLDPSVQAKILKLLLNLQEQRGLTMLIITHDIAVARKVSDRIAIMSLGKIVEEGTLTEVVDTPKHPHTKSLLQAAASLHRN
ncbi:MAG: ABC transporter ATP-binding protein [Chloroflexota bacterium]|nr:ABC transporter ATP-binding protein [Chloroflexota bacterium]